MRACVKCKGPGPFGRNKNDPDGLARQCKSCVKVWKDAHPAKIRAVERKAFIDSLKDKPCLDCGLAYPAVAMDFDHVRGSKRESVSQMSYHSEKAILIEISKCDLICANCHRIRTESRRVQTNNPRKQAFNEKIATLKSAACVACEKTFPVQAMEFDHVRGEKITDISGMHDSPWAKVLDEVAKCDLVCSNCHRTRTHALRQGPPSLGSATAGKRKFKQDQLSRMRPFLEHGLALLGTLPDDHIAQKFGIDSTCVSTRRKKLGILVYCPSEPWVEFLGTTTDTDLAEQYGKHPEVVRRKRNELGILAHKHRKAA